MKLTGIVSRELATGVPIIYKLDKDGNYISKEILNYVRSEVVKFITNTNAVGRIKRSSRPERHNIDLINTVIHVEYFLCARNC